MTLSHDEAEFWEDYAGRYRAMRRLRPYVDLTDEVIDAAQVASGKRILDVGCGPGEVIWRLRRRGTRCHVTGLDNSEIMLEQARIEAEQYDGEVELKKTDLNEPLIKWELSGVFDCIVAKHSLYPFADLAHMLRKLALLASPDATLVIVLPRPGARTEPVLQKHQVDTQATDAQMSDLLEDPDLREIIEETPAILDRYSRNLLSEAQLRGKFEWTGWGLQEIRSSYADQDWLVIARRVNHGGIKVWLAETEADRRLSLAIRLEALSDLEDYQGREPGCSLDGFDGPDADYFIATHNDVPVGGGRLLYSPNFQSEKILRQLRWAPEGDIGLYAEPTRTGVLPQYRGTDTGRIVARMIVGQQIQRSLDRGCSYWLVTMRESMRRLLSCFPWKLLDETVEYLPEKGGPNVQEFIWAATLDLMAAQVSTQHLRPGLFSLMFPQAVLTPEVTDKAADLAAMVQDNNERAEWYRRGWEAGWIKSRTIV